MGILTDAMAAEVGIEVGAVDIDFAANLGEGNDALVEFVVERELFGLERGVGGSEALHVDEHEYYRDCQ